MWKERGKTGRQELYVENKRNGVIQRGKERKKEEERDKDKE